MRHLGFETLAGGPIAARGRTLLWLVILFGWCGHSHGQWLTQTNSLRPGWNSVFLHVDATHATLDQLVGADLSNPIQEIWLWRPPLPTGQFVASPQVPVGDGSQWLSWTRAAGSSSTLQRLEGNGAYLVRLATNAAPYDWRVKGKPLTPTYRWTLTGLNFIGFPTPPSPVTSQPFFDAFLAPAPEFQQIAAIYRYQGGDLGATNPARVLALRTTRVRRDQAYWVRAGESYNQYFGPIQLLQSSPAGIRFGDAKGRENLRLRNLANVPITVTLRQIASEAPPAGQTNLQGQVALLLRGAINTTNLTFGYSALAAGPQSWNLAAAGQPGSELEIVLGVNRSAMSGPPGALFAGVLRFNDSLGLSQLDVAVSAEKASTAGLWVGGATAESVSHYLKPYAKATNAADFAALLSRLQLAEGANGYHYERDPNTGRVLVFGGPEHKSGSYLLDGPVRIDSGTVARPFPLRLIVHHDGSSAKLLQKVYAGVGLGSNNVVATRESLLLPAQLGAARRISAVHLPTSAGNTPWNFAGSMQTGGSLTAAVPLAYDDQASNPFLHTYHPDHDNLDATFQNQLARGNESYGVNRQVTLTFTPPANDFNSLTAGGQDFTGNYAETITFAARGAQTRQYNILGSFTLKRISDIATLTTQ